MRPINLAVIALAATLALPAVAADRLTYIYSRNGNTTIMNGSASLDAMLAMKGRWRSPFLWFQSGGKSYVIRDAATMTEVNRLFAAADVTRPQYDSLRRRAQPFEQEERALDDKIEALEDQLDALDDREDTAAENARRTLERKLRDLEREMRGIEAKLRVLEEEEERLDEKHDELEREAERQLAPLLRKAITSGAAERV